MTSVSVDGSTDAKRGDGNARQRAIRTFLVALALTPMLLVPYATGSLGFVSAGSAVTAVLFGGVAGLLTFLVADRVDFRHVDDAVALVAMLALVVVTTVVVWLLVPPGATSAFSVGCVAFIWAMALGGVTRHVVWSRFAARTG